MPRITEKNVHTADQLIGQEQSHVIPSTGDLDRDDFRANFETIDTPVQSAHFKELAFMEELVEIEIPCGPNPDAEEQFIPIMNNGITQYVQRGVPQYIKRKFVEVLARAKRDKITTPEIIDSTGARATKIVSTSALIHNFAMLTDNNPNGRTWLKRVLAEA